MQTELRAPHGPYSLYYLQFIIQITKIKKDLIIVQFHCDILMFIDFCDRNPQLYVWGHTAGYQDRFEMRWEL